MKLVDEDDALSSNPLRFLLNSVGAVGAMLDPQDDWVIPLTFIWLWPLRLTPCPDARPELCDWSPSSRHTHAQIIVCIEH